MTDIFWFTRHGKYGFLSNFYRSPIVVEGVTWPTVEHYYQAMKEDSPVWREQIQKLDSPKDAKFAGYHCKIRADWEQAKQEVMLTGLRAKFAQYSRLRDMLLETGDAVLHEDSPWDKYWGYAKGQGQDMLGKLLMQVRSEIR